MKLDLIVITSVLFAVVIGANYLVNISATLPL